MTHQPNGYFCRKCGLRFGNEQSYIEHKLTHSDSVDYRSLDEDKLGRIIQILERIDKRLEEQRKR